MTGSLYHWYVQSRLYMWAATTYLLNLVDITIFVSKSLTHVHVTYLIYLSNLDDCHPGESLH